MKSVEEKETMKPETSALICWYYECKQYTPVRISVIMHLDIEIVKTVLRRNCYEFKNQERQEKLNKEHMKNMSKNFGVHTNKYMRCRI